MGCTIDNCVKRFGRGAACACTLAVAACGGIALAQEPADASPEVAAPIEAAEPAASEVQQPADTRLSVPALTPVKLVIRTHLGSRISTSGESFPIVLAEPIVIDGVEVVPAGTEGTGEVVHARKSGGSGSAGELILAARYLQLGERRLRLRSMNFARAGEDATGSVNTAAIASAATVPLLGLFGFFVKGKSIDIPEGTQAMARTAEPFVLDPPAGAPAGPEPIPELPTTGPGEYHEG